jgi:hypothetical protein
VSTTNEPTSERSSTVSTDGSCDAFGRIGSSDGATTASGQLPESLLYAEYGLVNLVRLIPSLASRQL